MLRLILTFLMFLPVLRQSETVDSLDFDIVDVTEEPVIEQEVPINDHNDYQYHLNHQNQATRVEDFKDLMELLDDKDDHVRQALYRRLASSPSMGYLFPERKKNLEPTS